MPHIVVSVGMFALLTVDEPRMVGTGVIRYDV